jgi:hypothetical protein
MKEFLNIVSETIQFTTNQFLMYYLVSSVIKSFVLEFNLSSHFFILPNLSYD